MNYTVLIVGMAVITVIIKAVIFMLGERLVLPALFKEALGFVPVTVLTAIIVPMVLSPHGETLELYWHNPQLVAALIAIAVCAVTGRQLLTITVGMAVFIGWQLLAVASG